MVENRIGDRSRRGHAGKHRASDRRVPRGPLHATALVDRHGTAPSNAVSSVSSLNLSMNQYPFIDKRVALQHDSISMY